MSWDSLLTNLEKKKVIAIEDSDAPRFKIKSFLNSCLFWSIAKNVFEDIEIKTLMDINTADTIKKLPLGVNKNMRKKIKTRIKNIKVANKIFKVKIPEIVLSESFFVTIR